jgi:hypothetical protein
MNGYGQVYWGCYMKHDTAWRGILMDAEGREVWLGLPEEDPEVAFRRMAKEAKEHGITDLRPWSGDPTPIMAHNLARKTDRERALAAAKADLERTAASR